MASLARENLLHEKSKIALSVGGVVLGVFLIFTTVGLYFGISTILENQVLKVGADLWVTSKGSSGSLHSPSFLPLALDNNIRGIDGVQKLAPLIRMGLTTKIDGQEVLMAINGYDTQSGLGAPWKVVAGASQPQSGEVIVDRVLAKKYHLGVGGDIDMGGKVFRIVGLSDETNILIASAVFITFEDARDFLPGGITNFFLVKVDSPSRIVEVQDKIQNALPQVSVRISEDVARQSKDEVAGSFLPIILVISGIGVLVGVLVVGLLVYTLTIEKSLEYGVLKAVGATNFYLYKIVLFQSLFVSVLGFIIGAVITRPAISLIQNLVPEFVITVMPSLVLWVFLLFVVTGVVASFIPIRRLSGIDPAIVFKGR